MLKKINNKGFSLVELLAVMVILGILLSMSIIAYSRYKAKSKEQAYDTLATSAARATEEYIMDYPGVTSVSIEKLNEEGYLSSIEDPGKNNNLCTGVVVVVDSNEETDDSLDEETDDSLDEKTYEIHLCCANYNYTYQYPGDSKSKDTKCRSNDTSSSVSTPSPSATSSTTPSPSATSSTTPSPSATSSTTPSEVIATPKDTLADGTQTFCLEIENDEDEYTVGKSYKNNTDGTVTLTNTFTSTADPDLVSKFYDTYFCTNLQTSCSKDKLYKIQTDNSKKCYNDVSGRYFYAIKVN